MSKPVLSLHRVAYDPEEAAFRAEAQIVDITGIQRRPCFWRGPLGSDFARIATGLQEDALKTAA